MALYYAIESNLSKNRIFAVYSIFIYRLLEKLIKQPFPQNRLLFFCAKLSDPLLLLYFLIFNIYLTERPTKTHRKMMRRIKSFVTFTVTWNTI